MSRPICFVARALVVLLSLHGICRAQTGFGVNGNGILFSFDVNGMGSIPINTIGNLGFTPEGIDFRPGTNTLYAIEVGATTTQLYTVNISTGAATATSSSFPTVGADYNLSGNQHFGFDFNPTTVQGDLSMRIRLIATNGDNLRINSATGALAASDTDLVIPPSSLPFADASAYLNNVPTAGVLTTTLYDMDSRNASLYTQNPPNNGTLNLVGPFFASSDTVSVGIGFDIYTVPTDVDPSTVGDSAYAVLKRPATSNGAYLLYRVNLTTGEITNGKLVGPNGTPSDFTGGFAIAPLPVPEPAGLALVAVAIATGAGLRGRRT